MSSSRWAAVAAILFAVLFFVGVLFASDTPDGDAADQAVAAHWNKSGNEIEALIGAYALAVAAILLVVLVTNLLPGDPSSGAMRVARTTGVLAAAAFGVGGVALASPGASALFDNATVTASGSSLITSVGFGAVTLFGAIAAAAMIAALSFEWRGSGVMPGWLTGLGFVLAVILLFGVVFFPMLALPLWALLVGIVLLTRGERVPVAAAAFGG